MRAAWITDIHLVFLDDDEEQRARFYRQLTETPCDVFFLSGDIGEGPTVATYLAELDSAVQRPIYFVLGNHDYYGSGFSTIRNDVAELCDRSQWLRFVQDEAAIALSNKTGLIGHECWGDGGWGDFFSSGVLPKDWKAIDELKAHWLVRSDPSPAADPASPAASAVEQAKRPPLDSRRAAVLKVLRQLGQEAAEHFRRVLPAAASQFHDVIALTHVPPFPHILPKARLHPPEEFLPVAICRAAGDTILNVMAEHPGCQLRILAGHLHEGGTVQVAENIQMSVGSAEYGEPGVQDILTID